MMRIRLFTIIGGAYAIYYVIYSADEHGMPWQISVLLILSVVIYAIVTKFRREFSALSETPDFIDQNDIHRNRTRKQVKIAQGREALNIEKSLDSLPKALLSRSGSVFYTGKSSFTGQRPLYILGLNPGGSPERQRLETIGSHIETYRSRTRAWSAYADDSWEGAPPGTCGMQPRVLHLLRQLGFDPRNVPASNVVFVRTRNEESLKMEKELLLRLCWPVHAAVIQELGIRTVVCFGSTAGRWVREQTGASELIDQFQECNERRWKSETHRNATGLRVVTVTHPSRADWRNPAADPTPLVKRALH